MRHTLALPILLSLLVAPAAASAADLPLDARGVKAEHVGGKRVLVLGPSAGRYDTCRIEARRTRTRKRSVETRIVLDLGLPLTQRGAVFLDEREMLLSLDALLEAVTPAEGETAYRTAADAIERSGLSNVVALEDPAGTPPAGKLGLYSDAAQHAAAVGVTKTGRRVFIDVDADALSTNLSTALFAQG